MNELKRASRNTFSFIVNTYLLILTFGKGLSWNLFSSKNHNFFETSFCSLSKSNQISFEFFSSLHTEVYNKIQTNKTKKKLNNRKFSRTKGATGGYYNTISKI